MTGRPTADPAPATVPSDAVDRLVAIWSDLLGAGVVNGHTDFLEMGGSSLTAVRIRAQVRAEFGRDMALTELLELRTPQGVAAGLPHAPRWPAGG
jgi:hypothetical protein